MSDQQLHVFISSTSQDLKAFREKAREAIISRKMLPIDMKDFTADSRDAVALCYDNVQKADVLVCIYGLRYGYIPQDLPDSMAHLKGKSITEMEYLWAQENGIDRLVFLVDTSHLPPDSPVFEYADTIATPESSREAQAQAAHKQALFDTFLARVGGKVVWDKVTNEENLEYRVSEALLQWQERQHPARRRRRIGLWPRIAFVEFLLLLVLILWHGLSLHAAGGLGLAGAGQPVLLTLVGMSVVPLLLMLFHRGLPIRPQRFWILMCGVLLLLLVIGTQVPCLFGSVYPTLAQEAIRAGKIDQAKAALGFVPAGDPGIVTAFQDAILTQAGAVTQLTDLMIGYTTAEDLDAMGDTLATVIADSVQTAGEFDRAAGLTPALARIDPDQAAQLAGMLNDWAVTLAVENPAMLISAIKGLEIVQKLDAESLARSASERSAAVYNLAVLLESDLSGQDHSTTAVEQYLRALEIDPANYAVYYAASSLLLIEAGNLPDSERTQALSDAIQIANRGWEDVISREHPEACNRLADVDLIDEHKFLNRWYCFTLMTTEVGALLARGNTNAGDTVRARELVVQAIALAQAADHFQAKPGYYPAEVYYYAALMQDNPNVEILCNITRYHDRQSPRQRGWAAYANEMLAGEACSAGLSG